MVFSLPATYYSGISVIFYSWLNAAEPERWPAEKAGLWAGGTLILTILFVSIFIYCVVFLIKDANKKYRKEQAVE
jgi:flagellar biogenesis protein FliO